MDSGSSQSLSPRVSSWDLGAVNVTSSSSLGMLSLVRHCLHMANIGINRLTVCHYLAVTSMDNLSLELPTPNFSSTIN